MYRIKNVVTYIALAVFVTLLLIPLSACSQPTPVVSTKPAGLDKISHFVFIMQENRSFDSYFGTYPGADGLSDKSDVKLIDPWDGSTIAPFHNPNDLDFNGPHGWENSLADINGGKMDGFVKEAYKQYSAGAVVSRAPGQDPREVMGWHDYREIPNYWNYAHLYVLQDRMFESVASYSLPAHLYKLAAQSGGYTGFNQPYPTRFDFPEITELLASNSVSWAYYVTSGNTPDKNGQFVGTPQEQEKNPLEYSYWNPLPAFPKVFDDPVQRGHLLDTAHFYSAAQTGNLPQVSWVQPYFQSLLSEHPARGGGLRRGMNYVTGLVNAIMEGPEWDHTAIFISWDDWGGFYDHVVPPKVDEFGYGIRVPGLIISPYAKQGYIDHNTYSFESWLKIVEERFGVPSMTARDTNALDMRDAFDFTQKPRPPVILSSSDAERSPYPQPLQVIEH